MVVGWVVAGEVVAWVVAGEEVAARFEEYLGAASSTGCFVIEIAGFAVGAGVVGSCYVG